MIAQLLSTIARHLVYPTEEGEMMISRVHDHAVRAQQVMLWRAAMRQWMTHHRECWDRRTRTHGSYRCMARLGWSRSDLDLMRNVAVQIGIAVRARAGTVSLVGTKGWRHGVILEVEDSGWPMGYPPIPNKGGETTALPY